MRTHHEDVFEDAPVSPRIRMIDIRQDAIALLVDMAAPFASVRLTNHERVAVEIQPPPMALTEATRLDRRMATVYGALGIGQIALPPCCSVMTLTESASIVLTVAANDLTYSARVRTWGGGITATPPPLIVLAAPLADLPVAVAAIHRTRLVVRFLMHRSSPFGVMPPDPLMVAGALLRYGLCHKTLSVDLYNSTGG